MLRDRAASLYPPPPGRPAHLMPVLLVMQLVRVLMDQPPPPPPPLQQTHLALDLILSEIHRVNVRDADAAASVVMLRVREQVSRNTRVRSREKDVLFIPRIEMDE